MGSDPPQSHSLIPVRCEYHPPNYELVSNREILLEISVKLSAKLPGEIANVLS